MSDEASNFRVPLTKILKVEKHPNADKLSVYTVYGFQVIGGLEQFKVGDLVIYVPIDSILRPALEESVFGKESKIKLHNSRVRQIKIRGLVSQGLLLDPYKILGCGKPDPMPENVVGMATNCGQVKLEEDLAYLLEIEKYEPPVKGPSHTIGLGKNRNRTYENKLFHKYNGLTALKWVPTIFDGEEVVIQEKLHGTNARAGIVPYEANNLWKRFKKLIGLATQHEKCYGSNNVEISAKLKARRNSYYDEDVYGKTFKAMDVFSKLQFGEIVYGEIIGPNIQTNYNYGLTENKFVLFDVKVLQPDGKYKWLLPCEVELFAKARGFEFVPVLYKGPWDKDTAYKLTFGPSVYAPSQKVREGVVVKSRYNYDVEGNKKAYKWVSEDYLNDKSNTDNH